MVKKMMKSKKPAPAKDAKKVKKMKRASYQTYIWRVLKQVHPEIQINRKSMQVMGNIVDDIFNRLGKTASDVSKLNKNKFIKARDVNTAVRLLLSGELGKHALSETTKAVGNFKSWTPSKPTKKNEKTKPTPMLAKAQLQFNPCKVGRQMKKQGLAPRIFKSAWVAQAAALEYMVAEIIELAGNCATENKSKTIKPRWIQLAICNDEELAKFFKNSTISRGGVVPHVHDVLKMKKQ